MTKKIVVSHFNNIAAVIQNNRIKEIIIVSNKHQVNDIYLGTVQKIFSSINAAFIKLGKYGKSGFIHLNDIKSLKKRRNINNISEILVINQAILVQIVKEPTIHKGPRLTTNVNLSGKYIVLMPFSNTMCISNKIYDENERIYLYSLGLLIKPATMGLLIKSSAQGTKEQLILEDLDRLKKQWDFIEKAASSVKLNTLIYKDEDLIKKVVIDFYEQDIRKIVIDSEYGFNQLYYYLSKYNLYSSKLNTKLQLYSKPDCILDKFKIKQSIYNALKPKVSLESGGHIVIESNEALTVIDVNSGSFNKSNNSKDAILRTNLYAAFEIAYQLQIRNINGVIVVDFIDMKSTKDQLQLLEYFNRLLRFDNAKPQIVQLSELGLVELTRKRRRQSLHEFFNYKKQTYDNDIPCVYTSNDMDNKQSSLMYKRINNLFFNKKFNKVLKLQFKQFKPRAKIKSRYFLYFDSCHTVNFFIPQANFVVPMLFYSHLIGDQLQ